jgi:hypothetical protein
VTVVVWEEDPLTLLEQHGYLTDTAVNLPEDFSYEACEMLLWKLADRRKKTMWQIAETLVFMERRYGQTYTQAALITGLTERTLTNYASTAHRVPRERRRPELGFSHHEEVASLEPEDQDVWLDKAVVNKWNRAELRAQLYPIKGNIVTPAVQPDGVLLVAAARDLVESAEEYGPSFLVGRQPFLRIQALLNEEL